MRVKKSLVSIMMSVIFVIFTTGYISASDTVDDRIIDIIMNTEYLIKTENDNECELDKSVLYHVHEEYLIVFDEPVITGIHDSVNIGIMSEAPACIQCDSGTLFSEYRTVYTESGQTLHIIGSSRHYDTLGSVIDLQLTHCTYCSYSGYRELSVTPYTKCPGY